MAVAKAAFIPAQADTKATASQAVTVKVVAIQVEQAVAAAIPGRHVPQAAASEAVATQNATVQAPTLDGEAISQPHSTAQSTVSSTVFAMQQQHTSSLAFSRLRSSMTRSD